MKAITLKRLQAILNKRFNGILTKGCHKENGKACALELLSVVKKIPWTDQPDDLDLWDLRALNDMQVAGTMRTEYMLPLLAKYAGSMKWLVKKKKECSGTSIPDCHYSDAMI